MGTPRSLLSCGLDAHVTKHFDTESQFWQSDCASTDRELLVPLSRITLRIAYEAASRRISKNCPNQLPSPACQVRGKAVWDRRFPVDSYLPQPLDPDELYKVLEFRRRHLDPIHTTHSG